MGATDSLSRASGSLVDGFALSENWITYTIIDIEEKYRSRIGHLDARDG